MRRRPVSYRKSFRDTKINMKNLEQKLNLKLLLVAHVILFMLFITGAAVNADTDQGGSLGERIKNGLNSTLSGTDAAASAASSAMNNLVKTARQVGILVIVGVILVAAYAFIFAGARKIAEYKIHALIIVVAIIFLFRTEAILVSASQAGWVGLGICPLFSPIYHLPVFQLYYPQNGTNIHPVLHKLYRLQKA